MKLKYLRFFFKYFNFKLKVLYLECVVCILLMCVYILKIDKIPISLFNTIKVSILERRECSTVFGKYY